MTLAEAIGSWSDRDEFLQWCRDHHVKGSRDVGRLPNTLTCLVARALQVRCSVWGAQPPVFVSYVAATSREQSVKIPQWMLPIIDNFDSKLLPEFRHER